VTTWTGIFEGTATARRSCVPGPAFTTTSRHDAGQLIRWDLPLQLQDLDEDLLPIIDPSPGAARSSPSK